MEALTCSCLKCHAVIGNFENLWDKIGKTYYSPICDNSKGLGGLAVVGDVRAAPKAGAIENSFLQDVACQVCGEKLGLKCDSAPEGHVLIKDQLILRVAGMTIVSDDTGRRASLRVRRKFSLIPQQPVSVDTKELRERSASLISSHHEVENGACPPGTTIQLPFSENDPLPGLLRFAEWAKDAIAGQRKDVDRVCSTVSRMEEDMNSFRDYMSDLCKELTTTSGGKPWEQMKTDVEFLKDEIGQLRADMGALPGSMGLNSEEGVGLSSEELEALTGSLMKINQKVNEVENLKLDLQLMKGRLKRFEDIAREFRQSVEPRAVEGTPVRLASRHLMMPPPRRVSAGSQIGEVEQAQNKSQIPRKRKSDEFGDNSGLLKRSLSVPVSKKHGVSTDPTPSTRRPSIARKPSGLSKVQLIDDTPSPVNANKFMDGNNSEGDSHTSWRREREYSSAPDTGPSRRRTLPARGNLSREVNSPNDTTPPPETHRFDATTPSQNASRSATRLNTSATTPRSRRRAYSEGLRNADGVRLTKSGTPDRRSGNYKYLKQYYEKLKAEKDQEEHEGRGDTTNGGGKEMDNEVLQSIEKDGLRQESGGGGEEAVVADREKAKRAQLEARDRLVRETLERELGG